MLKAIHAMESREAAEAKALEVASELEKSKLREAAMVVRDGYAGYRQESCALFRQPHKPAVRCGYPSSRVTSR